MADSNSLKVMFLFEAGARLNCDTEAICLAAHIYHRFFRLNQELSQYEVFSFGAACIKLANWFYERPIDNGDLAMVMTSIVHGPRQFLDSGPKKQLEQSIDLAAKMISINLHYQIDYKDTRMTTPGQVLSSRDRFANEIITIDQSSSDEDDEEERDNYEIEKLLKNNDKNLISSHRYLVHYLRSIKLFVEEEPALVYFRKIANLSWIFLTDFYWSPCITQHSSDHVACACLVMAIETFRKELENDRSKEAVKQLWQLLDKKWHLILCDDLKQEHLDRIIGIIVNQYAEYERVLQHEFSTYVIDPKGDPSKVSI